jgi:pimeloyl-ACP methyl ester carboxylesterase
LTTLLNNYKIIGAVLATLTLFSVSAWLTLIFLNKRQVQNLIRRIPPPFPNDESRYDTVEGIRLHYICRGSGPDVLLLHGIGANIYCWRLVIPLLEKRFRVWAVDIKGFGLSDKPRKDSYDLESQARLLLKFTEKHALKNFTIVGNSMGGAIGAGMVVQAPQKISHLVLLNSAHDSRMFKFKKGHYQLLRSALGPFVPLLTPLANKRIVRHYMKAIYGQNREISDTDVSAYMAPYSKGGEGFSAFFAAVDSMLDPELVKKLKETKISLLILWGENDHLVNVRWGRELHEIMSGSQFQTHPTGGHHLQEEEPEWVVKKISDFILNS